MIVSVLFVGMNWYAVNVAHAGVAGLGLATTAAATVHFCALLLLFRRRLGGLSTGALLRSMGKTALATVALCLEAWLTRVALETVLPGGLAPKLHALLVIAGAGINGLGAFLIVARTLRMTELDAALSMMTRRRRGG